MNKPKYVQEVAGYKIYLDPTFYYKLVELIDANRTITPETIGYLIGMARPDIINSKCYYCKKAIKKGTEYDPMKYNDYTGRFRTPAHTSCAKKEKDRIIAKMDKKK